MQDMTGHNGAPEDDEPAWLQNPGNWIAVSRNVREHPIVGFGQSVKPATASRGSYGKGEAWLDLLIMASYRPTKIANWGSLVSLNVGELLGARGFLAQRWNWTEKTVRVFLQTLQDAGMIEVLDKDFEKIRGQLEGQLHPQAARKRANVISVCNYSRYQLLTAEISRYVESLRGPSKGPTRGQLDHEIGANSGANSGAIKVTRQGPSKGEQHQDVAAFRGQLGEAVRANSGANSGAIKSDSQGPESNNTSSVSPRTDSTPLPPASGGQPELVLEGEPAGRAAKRRQEALSLVALYNEAAEHHGWVKCKVVSPAIEQAILKRVRDVGGRDQFVVALNQVPANDFLMGRVPGRNGGAPFRLDLSKLLSTRSNMGDVLAGLIDRADSGPGGRPRYWWEDPAKVASLSAEDWKHLIAKHCVDGMWALKKVGWPPGHAKCVIPPGIVSALRLTDVWTSEGFART